MKRLALGLVAMSLLACGQQPPGELMMAIDTNLSIPKDVDEVEIHIFTAGGTLLQRAYPVGPDGTHLPGTLGVLKPSDAKAPVTMRVKAKQLGQYRIVAEAVSVVPDKRTARVRLPIDWLCDGFVKSDGEDGAVSNCGDGKTCVAGQCVDDHVNEPDLPDFEPGQVFGGGTGDGDGDCFDTQACFAKAQTAKTTTDCKVMLASTANANFAILTEGEGICGAAGCLIPIDQDATTGWKDLGGGEVQLPQAICDKITAKKALGVATSAECPTKTSQLPTCGPWSSSGGDKSKPPTGPVVLASRQDHPVALAVGKTYVFWANGGTFGASTGAIKRVLLGGGAPDELVASADSPQDIFFRTNGAQSFLYWTTAGATGNKDGSVFQFDLTHSMKTPLATLQASPSGVTAVGDEVFYTSFGDGTIHEVKGGGMQMPLAFPPQNHPVRIVVSPDGSTLFWTDEGSLGKSDGDVTIAPSMKTPIVVSMQETPRAIAIDDKFVYWATFTSPGGAIRRVSFDGKTMTEIAKGQAFPSGVAVDGTRVYWTTLGDGKVWSAPKDGSGAATELANGQVRPVAIAVSDKAIYWANAGASDKADGAIVTLDKPQ